VTHRAMNRPVVLPFDGIKLNKNGKIPVQNARLQTKIQRAFQMRKLTWRSGLWPELNKCTVLRREPNNYGKWFWTVRCHSCGLISQHNGEEGQRECDSLVCSSYFVGKTPDH